MAYSLPGREDPIRKKLYRSFRGQPDRAGARAGPARARRRSSRRFPLPGRRPLPATLTRLGRDADDRLLPPVPRPRRRAALRRAGFLGPADPRDEGRSTSTPRRGDLRRRGLPGAARFPQEEQGVRHVLLAGYNTDMCVCSTTAGYKNLSQGLRRVPRRRRDHRHVPGPAHAAVRHQRRRLASPRSTCSSRRSRGSGHVAVDERGSLTSEETNDAIARLRPRRDAVPGAAAAGSPGRPAAGPRRPRAPADDDKALIAITLDLEMSRQLPDLGPDALGLREGEPRRRDQALRRRGRRRVKAAGGVIHFFAVGQTMEQEDVGWLKEIVAGRAIRSATTPMTTSTSRRRGRGHPVPLPPGALADRGEDARRGHRATTSAWPSAALKERIGIAPAGFRTPGGFADGLADRPDLQAMLLKMGFTWVSSKYPAHPIAGPSGKPPMTRSSTASSRPRQQAQPFVYPSGLVEVPMSPISDVGAFRNGRWPLESFLDGDPGRRRPGRSSSGPSSASWGTRRASAWSTRRSGRSR